VKSRQRKPVLGEADDGADAERQALVQLVQDAMDPIEPPPQVREDILQRVLQRTARAMRTWRALLQRPKDRLDD
jgi:truncated hemoglobin YjbI